MPENEVTDKLAQQASAAADDQPETQYGNIEQIKQDLFELKQAMATFEAMAEPLQEFTNKVNQYNQELADLGAKVVEQGMKLEVDIGAVARRVDALEARLTALETRRRVRGQ